jgi:hypothetical protein
MPTRRRPTRRDPVAKTVSDLVESIADTLEGPPDLHVVGDEDVAAAAPNLTPEEEAVLDKLGLIRSELVPDQLRNAVLAAARCRAFGRLVDEGTAGCERAIGAAWAAADLEAATAAAGRLAAFEVLAERLPAPVVIGAGGAVQAVEARLAALAELLLVEPAYLRAIRAWKAGDQSGFPPAPIGDDREVCREYERLRSRGEDLSEQITGWRGIVHGSITVDPLDLLASATSLLDQIEAAASEVEAANAATNAANEVRQRVNRPTPAQIAPSNREETP